MSECAPTVMLQTTLDDENNIGTVGKAVAGTYVSFFNLWVHAAEIAKRDVRLVDPVSLKDVARGEEGELWVKGPQTMM